MQGLTNIRLDSKRLTLREFKLEDAEFMFRNWSGDEENTQFLPEPKHKNVEDALRKIHKDNKDFGKNHKYILAICLKETNEPIGTISSFNYDMEIESIRIGYTLGKKYWNQGYMTEALSVFLNFLFDFIGLNRVEAAHDTRNIASQRVLEKNGFKLEGTKIQSNKNNLGIYDLSIYGLLKEYRK